jgi:hypothetical protein
LKSISSPISHKKPEAYIAEILTINKYPECAEIPFFWRDKKYQESYRGFLINLSPRIKEVGFDIVYEIIKDKKITTIEELDQLIIKQILREV